MRTVGSDIRAPLTDILGLAKVLARRDLDEGDREVAKAIHEGAEVLHTAITEALALSALLGTDVAPMPASSDVRDLLEKAAMNYRAAVARKGLKLHIAVSPDVPQRVLVDATWIRKCLSPMVGWAVDHTPLGSVQVVAMPRLDENGFAGLCIHVRDRNETISQAETRKLFAPPGEEHSDQDSLTRLSLWAARESLRAMGGDITAKSAPGQGTVLTLLCPASACDGPDESDDQEPERAPHQPPSEPPASTLGGVRILLVDDNPTNRRVIRMLLETHGMDVHEVASGQSALNALHHEPYDVVLMDILMPILDGVETFHAIRNSAQSWADIPVIAVTANAGDEHGRAYLEMGMDGFSPKPIDEAALVSTIETVLTRHAFGANARVKTA